MNNHEEPFVPEYIDEQIERHASQANQQPVSPLPQARFVHDLQQVSREYTQTRDRVWMRLSSHLANSTTAPLSDATHEASTSPACSDTPLRSTASERFGAPHIREHRRPGLLKSSVRVTSPLTRIAAVLVIGVLVGSMIWVLQLARQHNSTAAPSSQHEQSTSAHRYPCFDKNEDFGWQSVCKMNEDQVINQSKPYGKQQTLTLETAYADANRVLIRYALTDPVYPTAVPTPRGGMDPNQELWGKLTILPNITLQESSGFGLYNPSKPSSGQEEMVSEFDFDSVTPPSVQTLNMHLTLKPDGLGADPTYSASFDFSIPMHKSWIVSPNQTVTVSGVPVTLQRVVVSPSQTRFLLSSPKLQIGGTHRSQMGNIYSFTTGKKNWSSQSYDVWGTDLSQGKSGNNIYTVDLYVSLFDQKGQWTLRIDKSAIAGGAASDWVFHFTV